MNQPLDYSRFDWQDADPAAYLNLTCPECDTEFAASEAEGDKDYRRCPNCGIYVEMEVE